MKTWTLQYRSTMMDIAVNTINIEAVSPERAIIALKEMHGKRVVISSCVEKIETETEIIPNE